MKMIPVIHTNEGNLVKRAVNGFLQPVVTIPLLHETYGDLVCLVHPGDRVREGETIAVPSSSHPLRSGAKVHSSVPGVVEDIVSCIGPNGREERAVRIRLTGRFSYLGKKRFSENWRSLPPSEIIRKIADSGVINTFDTAEPVSLASQIENTEMKERNVLVVRLYDDDPKRITDSVLSKSFFDDIKTGAFIVSRALGGAGIVFAYDAENMQKSASAGKKGKPGEKSPAQSDGKTASIENADRSFMNAEGVPAPVCFVPVDITEYPAGFRTEIIDAVKKSAKEKPFNKISAGCVFADAASMIAVNNAL
ncbi:MAG: hypothetical protein ACFNOL_03070, partial [Treponema maltophilum]